MSHARSTLNGRIVDTFEADNQSKIDRIGLLMAGVTDQPAEPNVVSVDSILNKPPR